ncbi:hypothetical protein PI124_g2614 [Phytophthora idaei]|nr:hypothetical protein PI125_g2557 [Phytophthora idaei]KAG3170319.1 hypothetical protein PI126_g2443 [Phytophthora idaei]KAG3252770.1 hypothetical protein PI124_g2614 [Phytophthora idaei]
MGSTGHELRLKFLFANQDGVRVELSFPIETTVAEAKAQLMRTWPQNVPVAEDAKSVRLICMGRGILRDTHTLGSAVPAFDTHPTPVNVSVFHKTQQAVQEPTRGHVTAKTVESAGCGCVIC